MAHLPDLPPELLHMCCPLSHHKMLHLALGDDSKPAALILDLHGRRLVEWANHNLSSIHLVVPSGSSHRGVDPNLIKSLTLIDPPKLPTLHDLSLLTHLAIAFSLASHTPPQRKLSTICPPCVKSITLVRAPVEVDHLPNACTSLSLTRCQNIDVEALTGSLTELRLDDCNVNDRNLVDILIGCPELEALELPNNKPWVLEGLQEVRRQGRQMPPLRSLDASILTPAPSECSKLAIEAFPCLEELCLNVGSDPLELRALKSLKSLRLHLTQQPPVEEWVLQLPTSLQKLEVVVARQRDVKGAEIVFSNAAPVVRVQSLLDAREEAKRRMLTAQHLQELLCPPSSW